MSLYKFDRTLAETSTPDWVLYCRAAEAGFDALVTRDQSQISQPVEMYVLSRLHHFTIVTWKKSVEDPIREWGQLLAYLPEVKKLLQRGAMGGTRPGAILLPAPTLGAQNVVRAADALGIAARRRQISHKQANDEARAEIRDWLEMTSRSASEFDRVLGFKHSD